MTEIVTEFGKFKYNHLPMGMCASGDIFQSNVDSMISGIKGFKTYINDISVLIKESFSKHIEKLRIMFGRFCAAVLKVNAIKYSFGLKEIFLT